MGSFRKAKVGVIGCGKISSKYLTTLTEKFQGILEVAACADLIRALAEKRASEYGIPKVCTVEEMLADPEIEFVLNLTVPKAHAAINLQAVQAGKHVYSEKPFTITLEEANEIMRIAGEKGLRVGCAPDTFLGAGLQTCRKLIDDGWIGTPYAASGLLLGGNGNGVQPGDDPLLDMGPYWLSALVFLLGPIREVTGYANTLYPEIRVSNPHSPRFGEIVPNGAPTNVSGALEFEGGATALLQVARESFGYTPRLEIFGTEGILYVPDPNFFHGPVMLMQNNGETKEIPCTHGYADENRGIGLADMVYAERKGRPHRASGQLARHVLEASHGLFESSATRRHVPMRYPVERPEPLPLWLKFNQLEP